MKWLLPALLASLALAVPAAAQPAPPPPQAQTPINTYCWNGTAVAMCNSGGVGGVAVTPTSKSGTITLGGTSQTLMTANATRTGCSVQAQTGDVWINTTGSAAAATQPSFYLPAPSVFACPSGFRGAITIFGATTGITFAAEEDTVP